jgi:hypothetical protein
LDFSDAPLSCRGVKFGSPLHDKTHLATLILSMAIYFHSVLYGKGQAQKRPE